MLSRTLLSRGASLLSPSSLRPSSLLSSSSLVTRCYGSKVDHHDKPSHGHDAHGHAASSHGHDSHGHDVHGHDGHDGHHHHRPPSTVDVFGKMHPDGYDGPRIDHHGNDLFLRHPDEFQHAHHENAPYGILFGEVYEGKRKIPAWEWIFYTGVVSAVVATVYFTRNWDENSIEAWAQRTYQEAREAALRAHEEGHRRANGEK